MKNTYIYQIETKTGSQRRSCRWLAAVLVCSALVMTGCANVTPRQQRLVSKPNMQFYHSAMFSSQNILLTQVETSLASSAGSTSGGGSCSSCSD